MTFTELETSILPGTGGHATRSTVFFHTAPPAVIDCLKGMGVNVLALANNHAGDMGMEGVEGTVEEVKARGLTAAGLGRDLDAATAPPTSPLPRAAWARGLTHLICLTTGKGVSPLWLAPPLPLPLPPGHPSPPLTPSPRESPAAITVAIVAHASKIPPGSEATPTSPGVNSLSMSNLDTYTLDEADVRRILHSVSEARQHASIVLAYQHNHYWQGSGKVNEEHAMGNWKREWAHALIDSGATVYVAHGDPRLQGIEVYNGCPVFFCLGSFMFQTKTEVGFYGPEVWQSTIVHLLYHTEATTEPLSPRTVDREVDPGRPKATQTAPLPSTTFSIRLTPITLNEVGCPASPPEMHLATRGLPRVARGEGGKEDFGACRGVE